MSRFFIDRPVFAWVIAIMIMLFGAISIFRLPVELYPSVAPPTITVTAAFPGASAKTMENSVTQVIEQQLTGIDYLRYFASSSTDGMATITLTFEPEADPDIAQVQTQNKVQAALPQLPQEVQTQGVSVRKANSAFLLIASFSSTDGSLSLEELGDMVSSQIKEAVARVNGVGDVQVFGSPRAMRIWLDPNKLYSYNLAVSDVRSAIQAQNTDVSAGQIGGLPAVEGQQLTATLSAQSRLQTEDEFRRIILRVNPDGSQVRLGDVARVELGSQSYERNVRYERKPAAGLAVTLASGANALETADAVKERIENMRPYLPEQLVVVYPNDSTPFVRHSINGVLKTLAEAAGLVLLVMFLFLQNLRATLIPAISVPVVLLGTMGVLFAFGFTINTLTMFAIVLTIGLLVDDAIVVVENVERLIVEEKLSPREATRKSMEQISGALVGIGLVLSAVFIPMAFFTGSAGVIYRQFSLTVVSAITLSVFVALVLSPTLCATLLRPAKEGHGEQQTGFFGWFNRHFNRFRDIHQKTAGFMSRKVPRFLMVYVVLVGGLVLILMRMPGAFLPNEDQGSLFMMVNTPPGATVDRTLETMKQVEDYLRSAEDDNVEHMLTLSGMNPSGVAQNAGFGVLRLKDWSERPDDEQSVMAIANRLNGFFMSLKDAAAFAFFPPPIQELGNSSGFDLQLVDQAGAGHDALMQARGQLLGAAAQNPKLMGVRPNGFDDVAQFKLDIDSEKATALGLNLADINQTLQTAWGSGYVNDFLDQGRIKKVYIQGDAPYRMSPDNIGDWYVRNNQGEMIPFSEFSSGSWIYGSPKLERFNGSASINIQGSPAPGVSSGEAMMAMEKLVDELPGEFSLQWSGISYEERQSGAQAPLLYTLSILVVFLSLAALYESWSVPFAIILVVPLGVIGAALASWSTGQYNDVYFQVALLTAIGLTAKNAILIVEFAKRLYEDGHDLMDATMRATKQRFRPIIMTSMAFMLGVLPMAIASGAGSASQNAIGIGVIGGMASATFLATFFVPMFYVAVEKFVARNKAPAAAAETPLEA
ncbi:efflux RND transporter permease subunit [Gilvimarinus sp. F26214L]|uniref:efflux RND transporter permease subunit n=1 Tax=Gilvimarinus sp. DZF01 TaxID=3461371 RepID=UPI0040463EB7